MVEKSPKLENTIIISMKVYNVIRTIKTKYKNVININMALKQLGDCLSEHSAVAYDSG